MIEIGLTETPLTLVSGIVGTVIGLKAAGHMTTNKLLLRRLFTSHTFRHGLLGMAVSRRHLSSLALLL